MLRISPAAGSATFGYIYLAEAELRHQDAITAYFDSTGRSVTVLPCPDFDSFLANTSLIYRDVLFLTNLPRYVILAGIRILEANSYMRRHTSPGSPLRPTSRASSLPPAPRVRPARLLRSTPAPSYHATSPPSDVARTQTGLPPPLCTTLIPAPPSGTSTWGGIWLVKAEVMGGCPH